MPGRKPNPAAVLAGRMLDALEAQRRLGPDAYPLALGRLAAHAGHDGADELVIKAAAARPFKDRAVAAQPKDPLAPVALADDAHRLAGSDLLLMYALERCCSAQHPTCTPAKLKAQVTVKLRPAFEAALKDRVARHDLPPGVARVTVKRSQLLHLTRYPLPLPPEAALAEAILRVLHEQRRLGATAYPLTLTRLIELGAPGAAPALVARALKQPAFKDASVVAMSGPDAPVALRADRDRLAASPIVLQAALARTRSATSHAATGAELARKLTAELRQPFEAAVRRQVEERSLPPGVGCLLLKGRPVVFLMQDVATRPAEPVAAAVGGVPAPPAAAAPADFAAAFDTAFARLDRQRHNFVSLVELRGAVPVDRAAFDAGLRELRLAGRYTLGGAEGRHGISAEERAAGVYEDGALLLYVSRRLS